MSFDCECVVIGAGVVGLAIAARLAELGREVIILESEPDFGSVTSARNSEVIHAGIYYEHESLKARYCVDGKHRLYAYCQERNIGFKRCGKLIVATNEKQKQALQRIRERAQTNGVLDLQLLDKNHAQSLEPALNCVATLLSPSTGIVDSHALMTSLLADAEHRGAVLVCNTHVHKVDLQARDKLHGVYTDDSSEPALRTQILINAAGHGAVSIMRSMPTTQCALPDAQDSQAILYKGNYFALSQRSPFSRLIYPVPEAAGLGVHLTLDLAGRARFGPDVEPVTRLDYSVDPARAESFYHAIRQYWPDLPDNALTPDYSGIRPRVRISDTVYPDFYIAGPAHHGVSGLVNLLGIESPGLTASLAIANAVADSVRA